MFARDRHTDPPRLAEWILESIVPNRVARCGLTGDLREAFAERRRTRGWAVCAIWYWRQALSAGARYGIKRIVDPQRRRTGVQFDNSPFTEARHSRMANIIQDIRYALRALVKSPTMAAISIIALTLGIGMPTIMFTVVNGVFRDLPFDQPEQILRLFLTDPVRGGARWRVSHHDYADWRAQQTSFESLAGFSTEDVTLSGGEARPLRRNAAFVTANAFDLLKVRPMLGRSFRIDDTSPAATSVVIVSHGVWQSRFAGDPDLTGRMLTVDGIPRTVIGVMPERFGFPTNEDLWLPLVLSLDATRADSPDLQVFGRLRDGVSIQRAQLELRTIAARLAEEYPETNQDLSAGVTVYGSGLIDESFARGLYTMLGAVSFVLLIACVNVANLFLARAISRSREIAVRSALGASRGRVISQFLVESFAVTAIGGVLGAIVAWFGVQLFKHTLTSFVGLAWVDIRIDGTVLMFVAGVVLLGSLLAGVLPALQASSVKVNAALKGAPRGDASPGFRIGRIAKGLVVVEIALSCALLVVSGLMIKGVLKLKAVDFGMPVEEIVTGEVELPREVYTTLESRVRFFEELEALIGTIPRVMTAALMSDIPGTIGFRMPVTIEGQTSGDGQTTRVGLLTVTPGFLRVLDARVIDGRGFTHRDRSGAEPVVLINRSFADRLMPDRRPIGRTVRVGRVRRTVVGVVPDLFMGNMEEPDANGPGIYLPLAQSGNVSMQLMVRTAGDPLSVTTQVRDALESLDPALALMEVDRVDKLIANETAVFDVFGRLFLLFGLVALFLASIGLYGVMTFTVRQRTREWGVRMALGATATDVVRLATKQAAVQMVIGLSAGLVIAGALSVPLANFFYQVEPWDRTIFATIAVLLSITGVLAALAPARRATLVDPHEALRDE